MLFDSSKIPGEIVDMVTMAQASLDKPKGRDFACAVVETFYEINKRIAAPDTRDDALIALGEKFSHLELEAMKKVVQETRFYSTPEAGLALFTGDELKQTMEKVVAFCVDEEIVEKDPSLSYGTAGDAALRFDPSFMRKVGN